MDDYDRKLKAAIDELSKTGIWRSNAMPPVMRLLRRLGRKPRPPHYQPFKRNFMGLALWFAISWGLFMWFFFWRGSGMEPFIAMISSTIAGLFYGLVMASYYERGKRTHNLSRWEDL